MLRKSEIFEQVVKAVSEVTEISVDELLSKNTREEVVDARYLLVNSLRKQGFYLVQIAKLVGRTKRQVQNIIYTYDDRKRQSNMVEIFEKSIMKRLGSLLEMND